MRILVTGSSGHLGEALVRTLSDSGHEVTGLDILDADLLIRLIERAVGEQGHGRGWVEFRRVADCDCQSGASGPTYWATTRRLRL
jgi:nucleoside-diphosphate-sugar epimerase